MRIRFTWQPDEWHEAVQLASARSRPQRDLPMMAYGVLGIMSMGVLGDLFHLLQSKQIQNPGGDILMGGVFSVATGSGLVWLTRTGLHKRRMKRMPPVPEGEQHAVFQETGWNIWSTSRPCGPDLRPWRDLHNVRTGTRTMVATGSASAFTAVPLRALSPEEAGHLQRLFARKMRSPDQDDLRTISAAAT